MVSLIVLESPEMAAINSSPLPYLHMSQELSLISLILVWPWYLLWLRDWGRSDAVPGLVLDFKGSDTVYLCAFWGRHLPFSKQAQAGEVNGETSCGERECCRWPLRHLPCKPTRLSRPAQSPPECSHLKDHIQWLTGTRTAHLRPA